MANDETHEPVRSMVTEEPAEKRGVTRALAIVVGGVACFLYGFTHSNNMPDGKTLLAVLIIAVVLGLVVLAGRSYRRTDRALAEYTEDVEGRTQQHKGSDHYEDGM